jgi:hypothetical protein
VKKSTLFDKFMQRWRPASGVRIDTPARGGVEPRITPKAAPPAELQPEPAPSRKLSPKDEAALALGEGFQELSSLMRGMTVRLEDQGGRVAGMSSDIAMLPELAKAQLDAFRQLADRLERQGESLSMVAHRLDGLPDAMQGLQGALDRVVASDARAAQTLTEFRDNMQQIQHSMAGMVESARTQADSAQQLVREQGGQADKIAETVARETGRQAESVRGAVDRFAVAQSHLETAQGKALDGLRRAQEDQATRLVRAGEEGAKWSKAVVLLLVLVFVTLASMFVVMLTK